MNARWHAEWDVRSVGVYVFVRTGYNGYSLLIHRRSKWVRFPHELATPGGFKEQGENAGQAAVRELEEEAGVVLEPSCLVMLGQSMQDKHWRHVNVFNMLVLVSACCWSETLFS